MEFDTTPITNVLEDDFAGRYDSIDFNLKVGETRYLPTEISEHLKKQMISELERKNIKDKVYDEPLFQEKISKILGTEIKTKEDRSQMKFQERVKDHELSFAKWQEERKKEDMLKAERVNNIIQKNA